MVKTALRARAQSLPEFDAYPTYNFLDMNFGYGKGAKLLDKSPFHSHGDITTATWANGLHHRCLDFNSATPDYVEIPASFTHLDFTSEDFSLVARIKVDNIADDNRYIFCRGLINADGYLLRVEQTSGRLGFFTFQSGANQSTYSSPLSIATWYTVGFSRDGAAVKVYVNGADVSYSAGTHINPAISPGAAEIGIYDDLAGSPFDGKIEFLRVFGRIALPASAHAWFHNMLK